VADWTDIYIAMMAKARTDNGTDAAKCEDNTTAPYTPMHYAAAVVDWWGKEALVHAFADDAVVAQVAALQKGIVRVGSSIAWAAPMSTAHACEFWKAIKMLALDMDGNAARPSWSATAWDALSSAVKESPETLGRWAGELAGAAGRTAAGAVSGFFGSLLASPAGVALVVGALYIFGRR